MRDESEAKRYWRHVKNKKNVDHFMFNISAGKKGVRRKSLRSKLFHWLRTNFNYFSEYVGACYKIASRAKKEKR